MVTNGIGVNMRTSSLFYVFIAVLFISGCSNPQPGPDKTAAGAVLGAGWGAGAGAVIGNQVNYGGEGAAIGAGFGFVQGGLEGAGYDLQVYCRGTWQRQRTTG